METSTHVFFYGPKPNSASSHVFSQWFGAKFVECFGNDIIIKYENTEQYMMAYKALLFGDVYHFDKIMETTNPFAIKKIGRSIKNFDPDIWESHKFDIVVQGNRLKFTQNPTLMGRLLQTKNKTIVEASPYDKIWGIGLNAADAVIIPQDQWPGQNLLGKALMTVRDENR